MFVPSGGDLQKAINDALPGDTISLQGRFTGEYNLPPKDGLVKIVSENVLPDRRITPNDENLLPIIGSGSVMPVFTGQDARNWLIDGVKLLPTINGENNLIALQDAENVTFDRILFVADDNVGQRRALLGNGINISLKRSHFARCWSRDGDSQAFCAWDGAGPYGVIDNYLEAGSENIMLGGADSLSASRIPNNITIEHNTITKPLDWQGKARGVKNLLELKCAKNVKVRYNDFSNCWADAQNGYGIVFTTRNQDGHAPWSIIENVLFEFNKVVNCQRGVNTLGIDDSQPSGRGNNLIIRNNIFQTSDWFYVINGEWLDMVVEQNTIFNQNPWASACVATGDRVWPAGLPAPRAMQFAVENLTWKNNLLYMNDYGFFGDAGKPWLDYIKGKLDFTNNALANRQSGQTMPGTNWYPTKAEHEANFNGFELKSNSPYQTMATDGGPLGARFVVEPPVPPVDIITYDEYLSYFCHTCGSFVKDKNIHTAWHLKGGK